MWLVQLVDDAAPRGPARVLESLVHREGNGIDESGESKERITEIPFRSMHHLYLPFQYNSVECIT